MDDGGAANWTVRGTTLVVWAAAAASAAYWGLKLSGPGPSGAVAPAGARQAGPADPATVARLLGHAGSGPTPAASAPAAAPLSSRFALVGVVASRNEQGAALIAVDGRPAKPYRVGSPIEEGLVLQSVQPRRAVLAESMDGPAVVTLEMPAQR